MKLLLVIPPMADLNTPYPSTAYLLGHLRARGVAAAQLDASLELALRLFSPEGIPRIAADLRAHDGELPGWAEAQRKAFLKNEALYVERIGAVVRYLQGRDPTLSHRILSGSWLPEGFRVSDLFRDRRRSTYTPNIEELGDGELAQLAASHCLLDVCEAVSIADPGFTLGSYAAGLAKTGELDPLLAFLEERTGTTVNQLTADLTREALAEHTPDVVGLSVPFPGNLPGALRMAHTIKQDHPQLPIVLAGGYANAYLREIQDPRLFDLVDYVMLDDGERPLDCLLEHLREERPRSGLLRTTLRVDGQVVHVSAEDESDYPFEESAAPSYAGLPLDDYLAIALQASPVDRMYGHRWNKLTLAHGCYWGKCTFCDTHLDYIARYEPAKVERLIASIRSVVSETGTTGFHWVDEAAPPALLNALSKRLLEDGTTITWWGNVRFEKAFSAEVVERMARAGCVMITAGLEVASDRLLAKMRKGVSVAQVARVAKRFTENGVYVHAYLMYGFPSETVQETVDSLELVRQMFAAGCLDSGYWHRFQVTPHSPIGQAPADFGVQLDDEKRYGLGLFELPFSDPSGVDHGALSLGLQSALRRYREGNGLERDVREWFDHDVPAPSVDSEFIEQALATREPIRLPS